MEKDMLKPNERQYWLWVTRPEYYLDDDGSDRESLDPENNVDSDGWCTCNRETKEGDFVFLWRTTEINPKFASERLQKPMPLSTRPRS